MTLNLTGQRYGRLTVLDLAGIDKESDYCTTHGAKWLCRKKAKKEKADVSGI